MVIYFYFQRKHSHCLNTLKMHLDASKSKKRKLQDSSSMTLPSLKQSKLFGVSGKFHQSSQEDIDVALLNWIVDGVHVFSEVDRPSFMNLWTKLTDKKLMCSKTLVKRIGETYDEMVTNLKTQLLDASLVCTTADCWTVHNKSFLGITCHWLDNDTLQRKSAALACHRLVGRHTYDVLSKEMNDVFLKYCIQNKIVATVTDNAANFVKAFSVFGSDVGDDDDNFIGVDLQEVLNNPNDNGIFLPPHVRCAAHTLNLVAVKDIEKALDDSTYKKLYRSTFAKCQALWNKSKQSTNVADLIKSQLGCCLVVPNVTRWNSIFSSVSCLCRLLQEKEEKIHSVCDAIGLGRLRQTDIEFLKEYADVMEPLAKALDILQGDLHVSFGFLLPIIHQLLKKLDEKNKMNLRHCGPLVQAVEFGVKRRFTDILWDKSAVLSACFHPRFKLAWISEPAKVIEARRWMEDAIKDSLPEIEKSKQLKQEEEVSLPDFDGFFQFSISKPLQEESGFQELQRYLSDVNTSTDCLRNYASIKTLFLKTNTALPSSAPVERLFSCGGNVYSSKRARLTDAHFEMQLLLNINKTL